MQLPLQSEPPSANRDLPQLFWMEHRVSARFHDLLIQKLRVEVIPAFPPVREGYSVECQTTDGTDIVTVSLSPSIEGVEYEMFADAVGRFSYIFNRYSRHDHVSRPITGKLTHEYIANSRTKGQSFGCSFVYLFPLLWYFVVFGLVDYGGDLSPTSSETAANAYNGLMSVIFGIGFGVFVIILTWRLRADLGTYILLAYLGLVWIYIAGFPYGLFYLLRVGATPSAILVVNILYYILVLSMWGFLVFLAVQHHRAKISPKSNNIYNFLWSHTFGLFFASVFPPVSILIWLGLFFGIIALILIIAIMKGRRRFNFPKIYISPNSAVVSTILTTSAFFAFSHRWLSVPIWLALFSPLLIAAVVQPLTPSWKKGAGFLFGLGIGMYLIGFLFFT